MKIVCIYFMLICNICFSQTAITKSDLRIRVFPKELFNSTNLDSVVTKNVYSDLVIVPGINYEDRIKLVTFKDLEILDLSEDETYKISKENSSTSLKHLKFEIIKLSAQFNYYFIYDDRNIDLNAVLFSPEKIKIPNKMGLVFGIPTKETITALPFDNRKDFEERIMDFFYFNSQIYENNGIKTTKSLFVYRKNQIFELIPISLNDGIKVLIPDNLFD